MIRSLTLALLLFVPSIGFSAPYLAQKKFAAEQEIDSKVEIAKLYNEEVAKVGSPLNLAMAALIKQYSDPSNGTLVEVTPESLWYYDGGGSGGVHSNTYIIPIYLGYKRSTTPIVFFEVEDRYSERSEDAGSTITIVKKTKVVVAQ